MRLVDQILEVAAALTSAKLKFGFGGALALAWCTEQARGTIDIDVNVFVTTNEAPAVLAALPDGVLVTQEARSLLESDGQVRLFWDTTPIDLFLSVAPFHHEVSRRLRFETFGGRQVPFLSCIDIAIFKVLYNRTKDWADLEAMVAAGCLDGVVVVGELTRLLGGSDGRIERLINLLGW
ncbi:MAG: hypothetical protein WCL38_02495 [Actinomycetota bacterium]